MDTKGLDKMLCNVKDFFVSYNKADKSWAEWIAWHLDEAGYTTIIQAWDFRPGNNFVLEMQKASSEAERTIAVLSPDDVSAKFTQPEWAAALAKDPTGVKRLLIPVRVKEVSLEGLLPQIVYVDLVGLEEEKAKEVFLDAVKQGRAKPASKPDFPQQTIEQHNSSQKPVFPNDQQTVSPFIQLPVNEVVGRDRLVDEIINDLSAGKVVQLWGMPGVGKSTLAAYIGSKPDKPKGSFLLDVRTLFSSGAAQSSREGKLSLEILIRACVEPFGSSAGSNPLTEAQNLFKDSERLLVLDNLDDADLAREFITQVRPKSLIITARSNYQSSLGSYGISRKVELISLDESIQQFRNDSQVTSGFDSAIAEICGSEILDRLPLAVNIVASQIRAEIWKDPEGLLVDLKRKKLDVVQNYQSQTPKDNARIAFQLSYEQLTPELKEAFLALGVLSPVGASTYSVAWMLSKDVEDTRRILNELKRRALVQRGEEDHYYSHTLLWEFEKERCIKDGVVSIFEKRLGTLAEHLLNSIEIVPSGQISYESNFIELHKHWDQGLYIVEKSLVSLNREKRIKLIDGLDRFFSVAQMQIEGLGLHVIMLGLAQSDKDQRLEGTALANIGRTLTVDKQFDNALDYLEPALEIAEMLRDWTNYARRLGHVAENNFLRGNVNEAEAKFREALKILRNKSSSLDDRLVESYLIANLGTINYERQDHKVALACWLYALNIYGLAHSSQIFEVSQGLVQARSELGDWRFDQWFRGLVDKGAGDRLLKAATRLPYEFYKNQPLKWIESILDFIKIGYESRAEATRYPHSQTPSPHSRHKETP